MLNKAKLPWMRRRPEPWGGEFKANCSRLKPRPRSKVELYKCQWYCKQEVLWC